MSNNKRECMQPRSGKRVHDVKPWRLAEVTHGTEVDIEYSVSLVSDSGG